MSSRDDSMTSSTEVGESRRQLPEDASDLLAQVGDIRTTTDISKRAAKHRIKSWMHFYKAIADGRKLHDLRWDDRNYRIGDICVLQEYDNINGRYTGNEIEAEITYITDRAVPCAFSSAILPPGYCILSLKVLS